MPQPIYPKNLFGFSDRFHNDAVCLEYFDPEPMTGGVYLSGLQSGGGMVIGETAAVRVQELPSLNLTLGRELEARFSFARAAVVLGSVLGCYPYFWNQCDPIATTVGNYPV